MGVVQPRIEPQPIHRPICCQQEHRTLHLNNFMPRGAPMDTVVRPTPRVHSKQVQKSKCDVYVQQLPKQIWRNHTALSHCQTKQQLSKQVYVQTKQVHLPELINNHYRRDSSRKCTYKKENKKQETDQSF
jgi:hypothetical protein